MEGKTWDRRHGRFKHGGEQLYDTGIQAAFHLCARGQVLLSSPDPNLVATLQAAQRQHALVIEPSAGDAYQAVRGLFSASQIARQLGVPVHVGNLVQTFAEIEASLNH